MAELTKEVEALKMCPKNGTVECAAGEGLLDKLLEPLVEKQDQLILKYEMLLQISNLVNLILIISGRKWKSLKTNSMLRQKLTFFFVNNSTN